MTQTIKQKCDAIGISLPTYYLRIKNGMTPEEALSTPNKRRGLETASTSRSVPTSEDQEPRAPVMVHYGSTKSCVFEEDHQKRQHEFRKKRAKQLAKSASAEPLGCSQRPKPRSNIEELGDRYKSPNKRLKAPALVASPAYDEETEEVNNYEYVNRKPPYYGPVHNGIQAKTPMPWDEKDEAKFNRACGGYTAVVLNNIKDGEFKYQIYSTERKSKLYTNDVVRFINGIIKICDPEGKTPFRVIER